MMLGVCVCLDAHVHAMLMTFTTQGGALILDFRAGVSVVFRTILVSPTNFGLPLTST